MQTTHHNCKFGALLLFLLVWTPIKGWSQTEEFDMVVEKTDGTELTFRITDDYPLLQYRYGGGDDVNTIEIQMADGTTFVPCPEIKRLYTRSANKPNAIEDVTADDGNYQIYTPDGRLLETLQKGVNILRFSDGTTQKVFVK